LGESVTILENLGKSENIQHLWSEVAGKREMLEEEEVMLGL